MQYPKKFFRKGSILKRYLFCKRGLTLTELILAIAIIGIVAIGLFIIYNNTVRPSMWMNDKVKAFANLSAALEQARNINGGRYPVAATAISNLGNITGTSNAENILKSVLGTTNSQFTSWTYQCNTGTLTIGVYVGEETDTNRQDAVKTSITNNFGQWTCGAITSGVFNCTKSNVSCG